MFQKLLNVVDILIGHLVSFFVSISVLISTLAFCSLSLFYLFYTPFEGRFSFNELDSLELLGFMAFILVLSRFFVRSKSRGESFWAMLTNCVMVMAATTAFCLAVSCLALVRFMFKQGDFGIRHFQKDEFYFIFLILHLITLYALTPLPELGWFSEKAQSSEAPEQNKVAEETTEEALEASPQADFFTDRAGSTHAGSMHTNPKP